MLCASTKGEIISLSDIYPLERLHSTDHEFRHLQFIGQTVFAFGERSYIYGLAPHDTYVRESYFGCPNMSRIVAASEKSKRQLLMSNGSDLFSLTHYYDEELKRFDPHTWSEASDSMVSIQDEERDYMNVYKNSCLTYSEKQKKLYIGEIVDSSADNDWVSKSRRSKKPQYIIDLATLLKDEERLKFDNLKPSNYKIRCNNERCFFVLEHSQKQDIGIDDMIWAINYKSDTTRKYPFYKLETGNAIIDFAFNDKRLIIFDAQGILYLLSLKKKVSQLIGSVKVLKDPVSIQTASISISEENRIALCVTIKEQKERLFFLYQYLHKNKNSDADVNFQRETEKPVLEAEPATTAFTNTSGELNETLTQGSGGQESAENIKNQEEDYLGKNIDPQQETGSQVLETQNIILTPKKVDLIKKRTWTIRRIVIGCMIFIGISLLVCKWNRLYWVNATPVSQN